ncbi:MAG: 3-oxoacyl-[acyl-carrier-protein] synthase III C-terminal domain-containing protein [Candidatus Tumulicola sp.]
MESKVNEVMTPTSTLPGSAQARGVAPEAGTIPQNGIRSVPVVLADFQRIVMSPLCPQDELKRIQVHFMTIAQTAKKQLTSEREKSELLRVIQERMARFGASAEHISQRQVGVMTSEFVVHDPAATGSKQLYGDLRVATGEPLDARMSLFEETAFTVLERIYGDVTTPPDGIVHVTCSGYVSPSPVQMYLSRRGWLSTAVTHSYHMGCYGAFPAVRTALGLVGSSYTSLPTPQPRVDIVHTEFLSLHFDLLGETPDAFVTSTLFADGFIKYSAYPQSEFVKRGGRGLRVLAVEERILPDSLPDMTLRPGPLQFDMSLSKKVPFLIRDSIADFVVSLSQQAGVDFEREKSEMVFAIHPGGPAILNQIRNRLKIEESQVALSRRVLFENGNMASATAPHIWEQIVASDEIPVGCKVLSMAFGPGLTVIGALFEKV